MLITQKSLLRQSIFIEAIKNVNFARIAKAENNKKRINEQPFDIVGRRVRETYIYIYIFLVRKRERSGCFEGAAEGQKREFLIKECYA